MSYPDRIEIIPLSKPPNATIRVPGSKSITNRALVLAALYSINRSCRLYGVLPSEDTEIMAAALQKLGYVIDPNWAKEPPTIDVGPVDFSSNFPPRPADLFLGNSGTSMRFLAALVTAGKGRFRLDGVQRMRERPIEPLLAALEQAGVSARSDNNDGCPPVTIEASEGWNCERIRVRGEASSQFMS